MKTISILVVLVTVIGISAPAFGSDKVEGDSAVVDILFVRPVGLAATVLGTAFFIAGLPFTIPTGSVGVSAKALIADPFNYTFTRPLGQQTGQRPAGMSQADREQK